MKISILKRHPAHTATSARALAAVLALSGLALLFGAQGSAQQAAPSKTTTEFSARVTVHELRLDVSVENLLGQPVEDLTAGDFKVSEDREPREIVRFERWSEGARTLEPRGATQESDLEPAPAPQITLAFDMSSIGPNWLPQVKRALDHLKLWLNDAPEGVQWSVVLLSQRPAVVLPPTADITRIDAALDQVMDFTRKGKGQIWKGGELLAFADPTGATSALPSSRVALSSQTSQQDLMARQRSDFDRRDQFQQFNRLRTQTLQRMPLAQGLTRLMGASSYSPRPKAILLLYAEPPHPAVARDIDSSVMSALASARTPWKEVSALAGTLGVRFYGLNILGLNKKIAETPEVPTADENPFAFGSEQLSRYLSGGTGGLTAALNTPEIMAHRAIVESRNRYRLVIRVPHGHDGKTHELDIRLPGKPTLTVRAPGRYVDLSPLATLQQQLATPAFYNKTGGSIPVHLTIVPSPKPGEERRLGIMVAVPLERMGLMLDSSGGMSGSVRVYLAFYGANDEPQSLQEWTRRIQITPAEAREMSQQRFLFTGAFIPPADTSSMAVGIYDPLDGTVGLTSARLVGNAPALNAGTSG